jgi:hypothetical protein
MQSDLESASSSEQDKSDPKPMGWLKVAALAALSAAAGGLAAAWFYRKTLAQMREAAASSPAGEEMERPATDSSDEV